ncbi:hypothetical protein [Virgisporangium aurantiacum]|uniref:Secreted protein n=1 Tax=Virgisporangium aurantiacum TaxID=175570 RepID=A0A8J3Z3E0_9ACTN|nr:hypothetical protein [Virgisporangium aurantiacum]GIJ56869.1 hypothetical protein Vau01_043850 [Virgisporangium aurantiacum]
MRGVRRSFLSMALIVAAMATLVLGGPGAASAEAQGEPARVDGRWVRVDMALNCVDMTDQARAYAVEHQLCTADGTIGTAGVVEGPCGTSWLWLYNINGGRMNVLYGYHSVQGAVLAHSLRVSWYNRGTGGSGGWSDVAGRPYSTYEAVSTQVTGAGYVTAGLSGFVTLVWGGNCDILNPTDAVTVGP